MSHQSIDFILRNIANDIRRLSDKASQRKGVLRQTWRWTDDELMGDSAALRLQGYLAELARRRPELTVVEHQRAIEGMDSISNALHEARNRRKPFYDRLLRLFRTLVPWMSLLLPRLEHLPFVTVTGHLPSDRNH